MPFFYLSLFMKILEIHLSSGRWGKTLSSPSRTPHQLQASHSTVCNLQANCYQVGTPLLKATSAYSGRSCACSPWNKSRRVKVGKHILDLKTRWILQSDVIIFMSTFWKLCTDRFTLYWHFSKENMGLIQHSVKAANNYK